MLSLSGIASKEAMPSRTSLVRRSKPRRQNRIKTIKTHREVIVANLSHHSISDVQSNEQQSFRIRYNPIDALPAFEEEKKEDRKRRCNLMENIYVDGSTMIVVLSEHQMIDVEGIGRIGLGFTMGPQVEKSK